MNGNLFLLFLLVFVHHSFWAQEDLFAELESEGPQEELLLPSRMVFTQKFLWGEKGIEEGFEINSLEPE